MKEKEDIFFSYLNADFFNREKPKINGKAFWTTLCNFGKIITKFSIDCQSAPRPEWSSFCEEKRRAKKRERRAEMCAIKIFIKSQLITNLS